MAAYRYRTQKQFNEAKTNKAAFSRHGLAKLKEY